MIPVAPVPEPADFDVRARRPGHAWLEAHPEAARPKDLWSAFKGRLADGFQNRCGYGAMHEPVGKVDHYWSWKANPALAYEWSNLRFCSQWINSSKQTADGAVLDPHEVGEGWFRILLPSLQVVLSDTIPAEHRDRAAFTLHRLHLRDDERIIRQRRVWLQLYEEGKLAPVNPPDTSNAEAGAPFFGGGGRCPPPHRPRHAASPSCAA